MTEPSRYSRESSDAIADALGSLVSTGTAPLPENGSWTTWPASVAGCIPKRATDVGSIAGADAGQPLSWLPGSARPRAQSMLQ